MIGVKYHNRYAVEEFFQLLKVPWEWYVPGHTYDVVIARKSEVPEYSGALIDLDENWLYRVFDETDVFLQGITKP